MWSVCVSVCLSVSVSVSVSAFFSSFFSPRPRPCQWAPTSVVGHLDSWGGGSSFNFDFQYS